jgi:WD repeat-containing protein 48
VHQDYVKCLATPHEKSDWIAAGGLDRKLWIWDINGGGERACFNIGEDDTNDKGSIYALGGGGNIIASGGPESVVRVWDPRSGKQVTKFVGHTDGIRSILVNADGDTVMSASSDTTVKIWSVSAGRCLHTLTMHKESVWSLFSSDPKLEVFHSADRSGLVVKTDVRNVAQVEDGICVAVGREHGGISSIASADGYLWTCTSSNSFHRWKDVDTEAEILPIDSDPPPSRHHRASSTTSRTKSPTVLHQPPPFLPSGSKEEIPVSSLLRLSENMQYSSNTRDTDSVTVYSIATVRKNSEAILDPEMVIGIPLRSSPDLTMEGQHGLIKCEILNDRQTVLTADSAGEVVMWDIVRCTQVHSFGKRNFDEVKTRVNKPVVIPNWCSVDTRTGRLQVNLDQNYCFDAEVYADEQGFTENPDLREDQRINLGKWVLRFLFDKLIMEEIRRDKIYRTSLEQNAFSKMQRENAPDSIQLPGKPDSLRWMAQPSSVTNTLSQRSTNGHAYPATPGMNIAVATPGFLNSPLPVPTDQPRSGRQSDESSRNDKRSSQSSQPRTSIERRNDYFSSNISSSQTVPVSPGGTQQNRVLGNAIDSSTDRSPGDSAENEKDSNTKEGNSLFGKKFRVSFGTKRLNKPESGDKKGQGTDEKAEETGNGNSNSAKSEPISDNIRGVVQKVRLDYKVPEKTQGEINLPTALSPSPLADTPAIKLPADVTVLIQEEKPKFGSYGDLARSTVANMAADIDKIEQAAAPWIGEYLLLNKTPFKEMVKVSFLVMPYKDLLPQVSQSLETSRLNANRMLRARKILVYIAEKLDPPYDKNDTNAEKPEEYLELYCDGKVS